MHHAEGRGREAGGRHATREEAGRRRQEGEEGEDEDLQGRQVPGQLGSADLQVQLSSAHHILQLSNVALLLPRTTNAARAPVGARHSHRSRPHVSQTTHGCARTTVGAHSAASGGRRPSPEFELLPRHSTMSALLLPLAPLAAAFSSVPPREAAAVSRASAPRRVLPSLLEPLPPPPSTSPSPPRPCRPAPLPSSLPATPCPAPDLSATPPPAVCARAKPPPTDGFGVRAVAAAAAAAARRAKAHVSSSEVGACGGTT